MNVLLPFLTAFVLTLITTPLTILIAKKTGMVDNPKLRPHPANTHKGVVPRAGGLAIYLSLVFTILFFLPIEKYLIGIFLGITILLIIGLADDKMVKFSPYIRLLLLFLPAAAAVGAGIGISFTNNPFYNLPFLPTDWNNPLIRLDQVVLPFNFYGPHKIILLADILAFFWIVTLTQIINWSKGVDGQMSGITMVTAIVLGLLSLKFYYQGDPNQLNIAILAFIVAGASAGFLIFNWHPSKIMPAFSGSTISAYMLAVLAILSGAKLATALLVLAVPSIDFTYTFWRRVSHGKSPVWGDRGHLHHRLLDNLGWSHQRISLFYILISAILGAVALSVDTESKVFAVAAIAVAFLVFILWLNSFGDLSKPHDLGNG